MKDDMSRTQKIKMPSTTKMIPMICSWCNRLYEIKKWEFTDDKRTGVSHGICPECMEKHSKEIDEKK